MFRLEVREERGSIEGSSGSQMSDHTEFKHSQRKFKAQCTSLQAWDKVEKQRHLAVKEIYPFPLTSDKQR